jgi:Protein of unknown function (DUF2920)
MSKEYDLNIDGHPNIYNNYSPRRFKVFFSIPDNGVNKDTGILLLLPGFGAHSQSKVYKKMRDVFSDKYNLITVQCDYFGQKYMQNNYKLKADFSLDFIKQKVNEYDFEAFVQDQNYIYTILNKYDGEFPFSGILDEGINEFNDMGLMQALDNINAVLAVKAIIKDNNYEYNINKIIAYGHSHGAYLAYLCNAFTRDLFTLIIDNSAWLYPEYLSSPRYLINKINNSIVETKLDYIASKISKIKENDLLNLHFLYKSFKNSCQIVSFHGVNDTLVKESEKSTFCSEVNNCTYYSIAPKNVDGMIFKSSTHGLDADFLLLFDKVMATKNINYRYKLNIDEYRICTKEREYIFDYRSGMSFLNINFI